MLKTEMKLWQLQMQRKLEGETQDFGPTTAERAAKAAAEAKAEKLTHAVTWRKIRCPLPSGVV